MDMLWLIFISILSLSIDLGTGRRRQDGFRSVEVMGHLLRGLLFKRLVVRICPRDLLDVVVFDVS